MPSDDGPTVEDWQREQASTPVEWAGELGDDCSATWAGLLLRAESMTRTHWWWAVHDEATGELLADWHSTAERARSGRAARGAAERAALEWLRRDASD